MTFVKRNPEGENHLAVRDESAQKRIRDSVRAHFPWKFLIAGVIVGVVIVIAITITSWSVVLSAVSSLGL